jgi:hypothetical protein
MGLAFFHGLPQAVPGQPGERPKVIMPSTTIVFDAITENGTWGLGLGHLGVWNNGRIRYVGGGGYGSVNLDWYGRGDNLNGRGVSYTNNVGFLLQRITFQVGDTDFFVGPQYTFIVSDSSFAREDPAFGILDGEFQSRNGGAGIVIGYDSRDHPFAPTRGVRAEVTASKYAEWLGGDFDYTGVQAYFINYVPIADALTLGLKFEGQYVGDEAPFYSLPFLTNRGIPAARFADRVTAQLETELRWDFSRRWSLIGFAGCGQVGDTVEELLDSEIHPSGGAGIRYLIAEQYGLRMGADLAYAEDGCAFYVSVGTGWLRP